AFLGLASLSAVAVPSPTQDKSDSVRTLTGCLSSGEKEGEYNLLLQDGSTWEIRSKTAKLADHIGHTVKVTGKEWHPDMHGAKEKAKSAVDPNAPEHGHLAVTSGDMVSNSCSK